MIFMNWTHLCNRQLWAASPHGPFWVEIFTWKTEETGSLRPVFLKLLVAHKTMSMHKQCLFPLLSIQFNILKKYNYYV